MKIEQKRWTREKGWEKKRGENLGDSANVVLLFGSTSVIKEQKNFDEIKKNYPKAHILGCSTAGEICETELTEESLVSTAISFEHTKVKPVYAKVDKMENSFQTGEKLAQGLDKNGLTHVLVISDGLKVNGTDLVNGLIKNLPSNVVVTGGLAGDGARFQETYVLWNGAPERDTVVALGLYGNKLKVGYGSLGGWDPFGPERLITKSKGNILYEVDGKSALDLYKAYLGDYAKGETLNWLLFPLSIRSKETDKRLVRTILSVNENEKSMVFAGDVPQGGYAQLMKANFDRLIDGAIGAAKTTNETIKDSNPDLAILISCVGRKLVLKQRTEEELEGVRDTIGEDAIMTGFYSYGEICPAAPNANCELHNQTMTITTFKES
jgi:hypothetical protein